MSKNYDSFYEKCTSGESVRVNRKRKNNKITDYKKFARALLILALTLTVGGKGISIIGDKLSRDKELSEANNYMRTKIVTYLENSGLKYSVLEDKIIFENDQEKLDNFVKSLKADGFSRDEVFYMVSQVCDKKDFDNVVKTYGYDDSQDFLDENYISGSLSNNGQTYLSKYGDMKVFENNIERDYVESVNELKEMEENKGLNR